MANRVTLFVPGLLDPVPYLDKIPVTEFPSLNSLSLIMSRGKWVKPSNQDTHEDAFYSRLIHILNLNDSVELALSKHTELSDITDLPIASFSYIADNCDTFKSDSQSSKWILRAEPCFMAPDRDQLVMASCHDDLSLSEAQGLAKEINHFFEAYQEESFWKLYAVTANRWYIISEQPINIHTTPPEVVVGHSLKPFLLNGADSQHWLNLFNEFQMILHQSEINKKRLESKKTPVNSLWLWGAGSLITEPVNQITPNYTVNFTQVYSDNRAAHGISQWAGIPISKLPAQYLAAEQNTTKSTLYVIEQLSQAINDHDLFSWVAFLEQFETLFLKPLLLDIRAGTLESVEIISTSGTKLVITRKLLRRWWKKKSPFYSFLSIGL